MVDKTKEEVLIERDRIIEELIHLFGEEVEIIDSFIKDVPHDANPLWFLSQSLSLLSTADVAYFTKDWDKYRGCKIEHICATEYGIKLIHEDFFCNYK